MSALAVVTKPADLSTDDLALVAAVRAGDDRAFELLFVRYQHRIAAYVRGMVRDHGRAEDITQEVFISALRRLRQTEGPIAFKPWIYEIAKNACIDAFRRARNTNEVSFDADEGLGPSIVDRGGAPDAVVDAKLAIDNLCGAFGGLSQAHHDILVMREFEGLTYAEIGERMGMSRAAVESTLFRARRRLSEEYEELVSGERCVRVRGMIDAPKGRAIGTRDQRRMARHIAHCQPCRRYARMAGMDVGGPRRASATGKIAALLPLPTFLRRRFDLDDPNQLLGQHSAPVLHWSTKVVAVLDPATVSGWPKAIATAATVAVAGVGAGAAVGERDTLQDLVARTPAIGTVVTAPAPHARDLMPSSSRVAGSPGAATGRAGASGTSAGDAGRASAPPSREHPGGKGVGSDEAPATGTGSGSHAAHNKPAGSPVGDAAKRVDDALPDASLPATDTPLGGSVPARPNTHPVTGLLDGAGKALTGGGGGVGASGGPPSVGDAVTAVGNAVTQGGLTGAGEAAGSQATESADTVTDDAGAVQQNGPLSTTLDQVLGGRSVDAT